MTSLRFLYLQIPRGWEHIPDILNDITSCMIDQVTFSLAFSSFIYSDQDLWVGIPSIIARPNFRRLRKLEFCVTPREKVADVERWVQYQLRGLESQDVLHISLFFASQSNRSPVV
jgi:hypothetical protein